TTVETWKDDLSGPAEVPVDGPAFALRRKTHQTIRKVTQELETRLKINTAVAALMELVNAQQDLLSRYGKSPQERYALKESLEALVSLLSPFAPHAADAMWEMMGHDGFLIDGPWPAFEADIAREDEVTLAVQVNGKLRAEITLPLDADKEAILAEAKANDKVRGYLENRKIVREIVVPGRIVNFVVKAP
ncbi:MAG: class I tRNA ligase family protein, partial [Acidobacteriota bacterium]